jgi:hypothetical protein
VAKKPVAFRFYGGIGGGLRASRVADGTRHEGGTAISFDAVPLIGANRSGRRPHPMS